MKARIAAEKFYRGEPFLIEVPASYAEGLLPGCMVLVSSTKGKRAISPAYILDIVESEESPSQEIELTDILMGGEPLLDREMLKLTAWIAGYYHSSITEAITTALPAAIRTSVDELVEPAGFTLRADQSKVVNTALRRNILKLLHERGSLTVNQLQRRLGKKQLYRTLSELERGGHLTISRKLKTTAPKTRIAWKLAANLPDNPEALLDKAPKQLETFRRIAAFGPGGTYAEWPSASRHILAALEEKGLVEKIKVEIHSTFNTPFNTDKDKPSIPTPQQKKALDSLTAAFQEARYGTYLLHGVTGSGKTLVYIELLKTVLDSGRNAIVLVPEISLTPQTAARFRSYFGEDITIMHSAMSNQEKHDAWHSLKKGRTRIALGARSTIFAPLPNIGAIIVDEEHDGAYKQDRTPRYHARDTAVMRARLANAICVLGSATPSFESYSNAITNKYTLLGLPDRIDGACMPKLSLILMKDSPKASPSISDLLRHQIALRIERNEQTILLQNRRGFSGSILCHACGHIPTCKHCNIPLVYHAAQNTLSCHYCGYTEKFSGTCPACSSDKLFFKGSGTERIEKELYELFPGERILRMDVDTTMTKGAHGRILEEFRQKNARILLGTQMVAKGLDFPDVTLVGVLMADIGLSIPDFRASERMYALLTQVAGRAGRSKTPGEVYLQVYNQENDVFKALLHGTYQSFFEEETAMRKALHYPPAARLVKLEWSSTNEEHARNAAEHYRKEIEKELDPTAGIILGPAPAGIPKIRNRFRYHLLLKLFGGRISTAFMRNMARETESSYRTSETSLSIDIDPQSLL